MVLALLPLPVAAADYPRAEAGRLDRARFQVPHRRGHARASPALHDGRRALRPAGAGAARHDGLGGQHADAGLRRRAVRARPAARCRPVLHHPPGRHRPRQIVQALRRPESEIPQVRLRRHGRRPLSPAQGRPRHQPPAPGDRQFDGRHAHLAVGLEISGFHGRPRAHGGPADGDVEPQLDDAAADHRFDPQRSRLEGRRLHGPAQGLPDGRRVLRHRHLGRHARLPEDGADARDRPTSFWTSGWPRPPPPMPTTPSTSGNPRATTTPRPAWRASRRRCSPSMPPTTSAIRRRPA